MCNTRIAKFVLPELIVYEKMYILQKICVINIKKNQPSKVLFGLLNIIQPCY